MRFHSLLLRRLRQRLPPDPVLRTFVHIGLALLWVVSGVSGAVVLSIAANVTAFSQSPDDDATIAKSLATMLRAGRSYSPSGSTHSVPSSGLPTAIAGDIGRHRHRGIQVGGR